MNRFALQETPILFVKINVERSSTTVSPTEAVIQSDKLYIVQEFIKMIQITWETVVTFA